MAIEECKRIQHSQPIYHFSPNPLPCTYKFPNSAVSQIRACALRQKGTGVIPNYREIAKLRRCCQALPHLVGAGQSQVFTKHHTVCCSKVWKNDQKDATSHTLLPPLLRYRAAVYKFSQVMMRGILMMEMLGTWVQAKLWAVLGLQRSNKLP